jgi:gliding motility-associated-like protein
MLTVSNGVNGCSNTATVKVTQNIVKPVVSITGVEAITCSKTSVTLNAGNSIVQGTASYLWNTGATTASITVTQAGSYSVTVTDSKNGCSTTLPPVTVTSNYGSQEQNGNSIALCISEVPYDLKQLLVVGYVAGGSWVDVDNSGGLTGDIFDPSRVNLDDYEFTYTEPGDCGRKITVFVNVNDDCILFPCEDPSTIAMSKVVTANDDGVNDVFEITPNLQECNYIADVKIFNRWGKIVYESSDYRNTWKGYHNNSGLTLGSNSQLPAGTYYYIVTIKDVGLKPVTGFKNPITGYIYLGTH